MRLAMNWLCLLIAFVSPLLSQAKIAYGLSLSLAEVGHTVLESAQEEADEQYDGQDPLCVAATTPTSVDAPIAVPSAVDFLIPALSDLSPSTLLAMRLRHGLWRWPPPTAQDRHALLQSFLF